MIPINEPAQGKRKSQIAEYLEYHRGPGGQTIGVSQGGVVQILPDETGSTEWFGRVLTAEGRPGAERWTAS